jgi:formylglycine-generating enzyme required for sulfatase activity
MSGGTLLENDALRVESNGAPPIAITLAVSSPPPWVRVRGRVEGSGPASGKVTSVTISGTPMADTLRATVNSDGSFEFPRVLPGRYEARTLPSSVHFSRPIVIEGADTSDVTIAAPNSRDFAGEFVRIPPGEFMMGCSAGDTTCIVNESPAHRVAITRPFEIGKYEVTQAQWEAVMGANPSRFRGADRPVENVNRWEDAEEFIARLNAFNDGYRYRLPTEAEWEYAARAGSTGPFQGASAPADVAWFNQNSGMETHPVGQKPPNAWGLHDMLGNVSEWVADWYDPVYYATSPTLDPQGPPTGNMRVFRGGSSGVPPIETRVSDRRNRPYQGNNLSVYGFRIVREQVP